MTSTPVLLDEHDDSLLYAMDETSKTRRRAATALRDTLFLAFIVVWVGGCGLFDGQGPVYAQTDAMGGDDLPFVGRVTPVEPGTAFTLEFFEYCSEARACRQNELTIDNVEIKGGSGVLRHLGTSTGGDRDLSGLVELEAVGEGRARVVVDYTLAGNSGREVRRFRVTEPDGIVLRTCPQDSCILDGDPEVDIIQGVIADGEQMISNAYRPDDPEALVQFEPEGAFEPTGDSAFRGTFRKVMRGDVQLRTDLDIYESELDRYGEVELSRVDSGGGVFSYDAASIASIRELQLEPALDLEWSDARDGFVVDIQFVLEGGKTFCSPPYYRVEVLTPTVCELNNRTAEPLDNDESFSSTEFDQYPSELKFHVPTGGSCQLEFTVGPPDGPTLTRLLDVNVPD
jgi:hypothetical protein